MAGRNGELRHVGRQHGLDGCGVEAVGDGEHGEHERGGQEGGLDALHVADHGAPVGPGVELGELRGLVGEAAPDEAGAVGEGQHVAEHEAHEHHGAHGSVGGVPEGGQHGLLGHEAGQRRHPGHGRGRDEGDDEEHRHAAGQSRQAADVAGAGPVVDDPDHEEERGLEQSVGEQHGQPGLGGVGGAPAHDHHEEAQLADGAVGEDQLEVVLLQGRPAAEEHGAQTQDQDRGLPQRRLGVAGGEARHEVHAGLDHRRGVQVRRDGGGGGHRRGQPEVEGDERGLRDGAHEQQEHGHVHHGAALRQLGGGLEELRDPVGARGLAQHDDAHEHGQAAGRGEHQRLQRRAAGGQAGAAVADEQEGEDGGDLPEDEQQQQVVGGHQAEHGAREGEQLGAEAADPAGVRLEVAGAVEQHQRAHSEHEQGHRPRQGVHPQDEVQVQGRDPLAALAPAPLGPVHAGGGGQQPEEAGGRHGRQDVEGAAPHPREQQRRDDGRHCVEQEHNDHEAPPERGRDRRTSSGPDAARRSCASTGVRGAPGSSTLSKRSRRSSARVLRPDGAGRA